MRRGHHPVVVQDAAVEGEPELITSSELVAWGYRGDRRRAALQSHVLEHVRPGVFAVGEQWLSAWPEQQIVARARALTMMSTRSPVFSHETAAAIRGLALHSPDSRRVHVTLDAARGGSASGTVRHRGELTEGDVSVMDGLHCTTLVRTIADCARSLPFD